MRFVAERLRFFVGVKMVTEKQPAAATEDFEIVDTTPPEVEAAIEEGMAASRAERTDATPPAPSTEAATPSQEPAQAPVETSQQTPAEPPKAEPPPRTYSNEEWGKMRRATAERENLLNRQIEQYQAQVSQAALESQVEATRRQMVEGYKAQGIDPMQAEQLAHAVASDKRMALKAQADLQQTQARLAQERGDAERMAQIALARDIIMERRLPQTMARHLMNVTTPEAMIELADELAKGYKVQTDAVTAKKASVPAVKVESGTPAASPANRDEERDNRIMGGQATEEDWISYKKSRYR